MKVNTSQLILLVLIAGVQASSALGQGAGEQAPPTKISPYVEMITTAAGKQGSLMLPEVAGDEYAKTAQLVAKELLEKANIKIPARIVSGRSVPAAVANNEIVIPAKGMERYTEAQVPFVIAHEIGHIALNHASIRLNMAAELCDLEKDNYLRLAQCIQEGLANNNLLRERVNLLNREQEIDADLWAVRFLKANKISADSIGALKSAHSEKTAAGGAGHPSLQARIAAVSKELADQIN